MIRPLDPRLVKVIALMQSTTHAGERTAARERAEFLALAAGLTLQKAEAQLAYERIRAANPGDPFAGLDEYMEMQEPGYTARVAAEKAERHRRRLNSLEAIIVKYESTKAALAPCVREQLIRKALQAWITPRKRPWERWTESIDGYRGPLDKLPDHIRNAVASAYPMPATFLEARIEHDYWQSRRKEIENALGPNGFRDNGLDLTTRIRADMVRNLVEHEMPVTTLADLHFRFAMYRAKRMRADRVEEALFRDLTAMVEAQKGDAA
jgi:hypothetical protein